MFKATEMLSGKEQSLHFQRTRVQLPAPTLGGKQLPVTPSPEDPTPSPSSAGTALTHKPTLRHTKLHIIKKRMEKDLKMK